MLRQECAILILYIRNFHLPNTALYGLAAQPQMCACPIALRPLCFCLCPSRKPFCCKSLSTFAGYCKQRAKNKNAKIDNHCDNRASSNFGQNVCVRKSCSASTLTTDLCVCSNSTFAFLRIHGFSEYSLLIFRAQHFSLSSKHARGRIYSVLKPTKVQQSDHKMPFYLNIYVRMSPCVGVSDGPFVLKSHPGLGNIKTIFCP